MEHGLTQRNSQSASTLHLRLQAATRAARADAAHTATTNVRPRRRLSAAEPWKFLETLRGSSAALDSSLSSDRAVRRILAGLLHEDGPPDSPCDLDDIQGPVLIIRSGPWPVLRTLLDALTIRNEARPISVLCHKRDADALARLAEETGLVLEPVFYPRFEPFVTTTLQRLLSGGPWISTFVLDASKHGRGHSLEHITTAVGSRVRFVWNGSGQAFRQRSLRERLGREKYALVKGLLRWQCRVRL
jgi:hypothetical protein